MSEPLDDGWSLFIPDFLRRTKRGVLPRSPRWKRMKAARPEGDKWADAERWEVTINHKLVPQGGDADTKARVRPGTRYVWVIPGKTWTEIRDSEAYAKIATSDWNRMSAKGRKVS